MGRRASGSLKVTGLTRTLCKDNLPFATFAGSDAQIDEALQYLQQEIKQDPRPVPKAPPYPSKLFKYDE